MIRVVGIPACSKQVDGLDQFQISQRYCKALSDLCALVPVIIPPLGEIQLEILNRIDGILLPGSRSNVWPELYGEKESLTPDRHDFSRDQTTIPLIKEVLNRQMPLLAICRGVQELNVALGGSLYQQVHQIPGRLDHRAGEGSLEEKFKPKHLIKVKGKLAEIWNTDQTMVNSLHEQAIDRLAKPLICEAKANDDTIEAVRISDISGFALGVQFHPEWDWKTNTNSQKLFKQFANACFEYKHIIPSAIK